MPEEGDGVKPEDRKVSDAIQAFLADHPDVTSPALILHGILEANPDLRAGKDVDVDAVGAFVQHCEAEPPP